MCEINKSNDIKSCLQFHHFLQRHLNWPRKVWQWQIVVHWDFCANASDLVQFFFSWVYRWHLEHLSVLWNTWWWHGVTHTHRAWGCWKCTLCVFKPSKCLSTYTSELYLSLQGNTMDQHYFSLDAVRTSTKHTNGKHTDSYAQIHTARLHGWWWHKWNTNSTDNHQKGSSVVVTQIQKWENTLPYELQISQTDMFHTCTLDKTITTFFEGQNHGLQLERQRFVSLPAYCAKLVCVFVTKHSHITS